MKDISIIIPHYNSWEKLNELLETIPISPQIEIIIVDDNSVELEKNKKLILEKFSNIVFLSNNSGYKGAGAARNIGLRKAKGDWLLFADADDLFVENSFELINKYLATEYDIVYFRPTSFIETTNRNSHRHKLYSNLIQKHRDNQTKLSELKLRYGFVVPWSKIIRHSLVKKNNIRYEQIMHSNDILFSAKVGYFAKKVTAVDEVIYSVRENEGSLTNSMSDESFKERFDAWVQYNNFLRKNLNGSDYKLIHTSALFQFGRIYNNNLSASNYFYVLKECFTNRIPIVDRKIFNLRYVYNYLFKKSVNS